MGKDLFETNAIIAKFMNEDNEETFYVFKGKNYMLSELEFHNSYDWLMPVVKKLFNVSWAAHDTYRKILWYDIDELYKTTVSLIEAIEENPTLLYNE